MLQKGGAFLVEQADSSDVFIPEDLSDEQMAISKTAHDFVVKNVLPQEEEIDKLKAGLMPDLLRKAAAQGMLMTDIPVEYGGLGVKKTTSTMIAGLTALQVSFSVAVMCHTGIATNPIIFYGSQEQKRKYLPRLASGEMLASFALTEPDAGSDAMAIKTSARLLGDKKYYVLNGCKHFITNGGFSDLFTVFANLDGFGITAFLVEKTFSGFTVGAEAKKMGIKGSSTVSLTLDNVHVPAENLLGEPGKGHHIAFNILNLGRLKLGAVCAGVSRHIVDLASSYAKKRVQFGGPIISLQMIKQKLAAMTSRLILLESVVFRVSDLFDSALEMAAKSAANEALADVLREYSIESSIAKVFGSKTFYHVADDAVQLHGGYGYIEDYCIEKYFRDSRINRIYEGTNEINRLVITGNLFKRAAKGNLDIFTVHSGSKDKIANIITSCDRCDISSQVVSFVEVLKLIVIMIGVQAFNKYQTKINREGCLMSEVADIVIELYAIESAYLRCEKVRKLGDDSRAKNLLNAVHFYMLANASGILDKGRRLMMQICSGSEEMNDYEKLMLDVLNFIRGDQAKEAENIVNLVDKAGGYPFSL